MRGNDQMCGTNRMRKTQIKSDFAVGQKVKRIDTDRVGQVVELLPGHAAKIQWPSGHDDWLPLSLLTHESEEKVALD